ncbi:MAG TPA: carboxypeptidase-like regulatory domain-containing protein [Gemmatimonadaceae bacterium]|jgi:hypothetical protein
MMAKTAFALIAALSPAIEAQVIHGTVTSAVANGRVPGAVVLLRDSSLTYARALTSDSGTFTIGAGVPGRYYLRVMRIGFRPTESAAFDLRGDTTVALTLTDIPVVLPEVATRDRGDCHVHTDSTPAATATYALWEQAKTALFAAAITLEERDYRFTKVLHVRTYDTKHQQLRDVSLRELEAEGTAPWASLPAEKLRKDGYATEDDSGMTFFAPDLDVLLSPYFADEHCFRLTASRRPDPSELGLDFEPAHSPKHVEIRGTLWLDSATTELRALTFTYVNLPIDLSRGDTLLGGRVSFKRLATGAWILPNWNIRMPTPLRTLHTSAMRGLEPMPVSAGRRGRWRLTTDVVRVAGGDLRAVKRGDSTQTVLWRKETGTVRVFAALSADGNAKPAAGAIVRLVGSPYEADADAGAHVRFEQVLPGEYLFEATTALHEIIDAVPARVAVTAKPNEVVDARVNLIPLAAAAATVCQVDALEKDRAVVAGRVWFGDSTLVAHARVAVEWPGGDAHADTRDDGWFRICNVPTGTLLLVKASRGSELSTTTVTIAPGEIVQPLVLRLSR